MKKLVCNLYSFDELSEDAKHAVCDRERERDYNFGMLSQEDHASERIATLEEFCDLFKIHFDVDYDHCHRFINWRFFEWDYYLDPDETRGKYLWRFLDKVYYKIRQGKYYGKLIPHEKDREHPAGLEHIKRHSKIIWEEQTCPFTGVCYDCDILAKIFEWYKHPDETTSVRDLIQSCFDHFLKLWDDEDDYDMSDEGIGDMISANWEDKLYFEDGTEFTGDYDSVTDYLEEVAA